MTLQAAKLIHENISQTDATQELYLPDDLTYFQGHFPSHNLLPGLTQIQWAIALAEKISGNRILNKIKRLKFTHIIHPETTIYLNVCYCPEKNRATFRYYDKLNTFSQGQLHYAAESCLAEETHQQTNSSANI